MQNNTVFYDLILTKIFNFPRPAFIIHCQINFLNKTFPKFGKTIKVSLKLCCTERRINTKSQFFDYDGFINYNCNILSNTYLVNQSFNVQVNP